MTLRPLRADDVDWLADMIGDRAAVGVHNWGGPVDREHVRTRLLLQLTEPDANRAEVGRLIVELAAEGREVIPIGSVSWRAVQWGPTPESACPSIGIALLPAFRGGGHGTTAQRLLVRHLFARYPFQRVQADTAVDNPAERKALERAGFTCEGLLRAAEFRNGRFHDHLLYSVLRHEVGGLA